MLFRYLFRGHYPVTGLQVTGSFSTGPLSLYSLSTCPDYSYVIAAITSRTVDRFNDTGMVKIALFRITRLTILY
jgi:hypothetical protein